MKDAHMSTAATTSTGQTTSSEPEQHSQCGQSCTVAPAASRRSWSSRVVGGGGAWSEPLVAVGFTGSPSWLPGEPSSLASSVPSSASRGGEGEVSRSVRKVESSRPSVFRVGWWTWSESGRKWFHQLRDYKCSLLPL